MNWKNIATALIVAVLLQSGNSVSAPKPGKDDWSVRLILKSDTGGLEDPYNVLGQMEGASVQADDFDLYELEQTFPGTYLSVIFYRPEWGQEEETYNTDFHPVDSKSGDEWTFEVRSDDPTRDLSLTWVAENTSMKNMVLVDLEENTVLAAEIKGQPQTYYFRMHGTVRAFAWRVLTDREFKDFEKVARRAASESKKSDWLPQGWGQGKGKGYRGDSIPEGLPDDPFTE
ncbi:MAG: hypothetical protein R3E64_11910 [Halioglobus sp.]